MLDFPAALEADLDPQALDGLFTPNAVQREFPNALVPHGATRDLAALREGARRGRTVVCNQRFEVKSQLAAGNQVAVEEVWTAQLLVPLGTRAPGDTLTAHLGMFFTVEDGRIAHTSATMTATRRCEPARGQAACLAMTAAMRGTASWTCFSPVGRSWSYALRMVPEARRARSSVMPSNALATSLERETM